MKKLLIITAIAATITGITISKPNAAVSSETHTFYYADAAKTQLVGEYIFTCNNDSFLEGQQTPYHTTTTTPCSDPGCFETDQGCYNDF